MRLILRLVEVREPGDSDDDWGGSPNMTECAWEEWNVFKDGSNVPSVETIQAEIAKCIKTGG